MERNGLCILSPHPPNKQDMVRRDTEIEWRDEGVCGSIFSLHPHTALPSIPFLLSLSCPFLHLRSSIGRDSRERRMVKREGKRKGMGGKDRYVIGRGSHLMVNPVPFTPRYESLSHIPFPPSYLCISFSCPSGSSFQVFPRAATQGQERERDREWERQRSEDVSFLVLRSFLSLGQSILNILIFLPQRSFTIPC